MISDLKGHIKKHHLATDEECGQGVGARAKSGGGATARARSDESLLSCANVTLANQRYALFFLFTWFSDLHRQGVTKICNTFLSFHTSKN